MKVVIMKTYEQMNEFEKCYCRLGYYMFWKYIDGKKYWRID